MVCVWVCGTIGRQNRRLKCLCRHRFHRQLPIRTVEGDTQPVLTLMAWVRYAIDIVCHIPKVREDLWRIVHVGITWTAIFEVLIWKLSLWWIVEIFVRESPLSFMLWVSEAFDDPLVLQLSLESTINGYWVTKPEVSFKTRVFDFYIEQSCWTRTIIYFVSIVGGILIALMQFKLPYPREVQSPIVIK